MGALLRLGALCGFVCVASTALAGYFPATFQWIGGTGASTLDVGGTTQFFPIVGHQAPSTTAPSLALFTNISVRLVSFSCVLSAAPGAGKSRTFTIEANGVDTNWVCPIVDAETTCTPDTSGSVVVSTTGIVVQTDPVNNPAAATAKCVTQGRRY